MELEEGRCGDPGEGGGLLSLEKGTNCGPTSQELSASRAKMATKRGAVQS